MSTRMSFFWNLAAEQRLGGRKWNLFLDRETWRKMTADRCITIGGCWCCSEDLDWTGGWCSSTTCFTENSWAWSRGAASLILYYAVSFILFLHENSCVFNKSFYCRGACVCGGGSSAPRWFPWEGLICPLRQKGETVQPYYFLALPWPACHMTWPTVNLDSQNPQNSTLFFLCVLCSFFPLRRGDWVELYHTCLPAGEI